MKIQFNSQVLSPSSSRPFRFSLLLFGRSLLLLDEI